MSQTEIDKDYILTVKMAIERMDVNFLRESLSELHPADTAEVLDSVSMNEAQSLYLLLEEEKAAGGMMEVEEDVREKFLAALSSKQIAEQVIENIDTDDAADLLGELSEEKKAEVISHLEDPEHASDIVQLLNYEEDTALLNGRDNPRDLSCYIQHSLDNLTDLIGGLSIGLTNGSPDFSMTAGYSVKF